MKWKGKKTSKSTLDWAPVRDSIKKHGIRNSNTMAIAPNASIAYQVGCEQSIEPFFSVLFRYENKSGNYYIVNFHFVDAMRERGLWNNEMAEAVKQADGDVSLLNIPEDLKQIYKIAFDRNQEKLIEATAQQTYNTVDKIARSSRPDTPPNFQVRCQAATGQSCGARGNPEARAGGVS